MNLTEQFYSQFGEDAWLVENKILPEKGFFLDLGAGHYQSLSNTYYLEQHGWDGICVDADIRQLPGLLEHRKNVVFGAIANRSGISDFYMNSDLADISGLTYSGNSKKMNIGCFSIRELLQHFWIFNIDLLSIDIEGMEEGILRDMFAEDIYPKVIIVEYNTSGKNNSLNIEILFNDTKRYSLIYTTEANFIYTLK